MERAKRGVLGEEHKAKEGARDTKLGLEFRFESKKDEIIRWRERMVKERGKEGG